LLIVLFSSCNNGQIGNIADFENLPEATFIGNQTCAECHENAFNNWVGSDHDKAMDTATVSSVVGDFNEAEITTDDGFTTKFYKRDNRFYVYTRGPEGKPEEFEISYTFGVRPLQQYLIPFENGRLQCLPYAWDTENNEWYSLNERVYHGQDIPPDDWLYWTNNGQNWNAMCAECHSTNLKVNYDLDTREFHTTWSEINVSCEACHGPASNHQKWSEVNEEDRPEIPHDGFDRKTIELNAEQLLDQCAYCHARRSSMTDNGTTGDAYLNHFIPQIISSSYYYPDGQIKEEDYVFASFTQTRMYKSHVKCTDCHEPHSLKTKQQGNLLCLQCHDWRDYDTEKHHFHKITGIDSDTVLTQNGFFNKGDGTQCVDCHMTGGIYMGADFRRDHSIRIPRPDVAQKTGSPDACTACHTDKSYDWAMDSLRSWYPEFNDSTHYGELFLASENGDYSSLGGLINLVNDTGTAEMVKAAAIEHLAFIPNPIGLDYIVKFLNDTLPLVRLSATRSYFNPNADEIIQKIGPALTDSLLAIRIVAAEQIMAINKPQLDTFQLMAFKKVENEYLNFQKKTAYFPASRYNLGVYYMNHNEIKKAVHEFKTSLKIDAQYFPAMLNLAVLFSRIGDNQKAEKWLAYTLKEYPDNIDALRYMGLLKAEQKKYNQAIIYMEKVIEINPDNPRIYYNLGLMYQQTGDLKKTEKALQSALSIDPQNYDYLYGLAYFYLQTKNYKNAGLLSQKIVELYPNEEGGYIIQATIQAANQK
jgi:tetratricopeptide (TPR) repeat protein